MILNSPYISGSLIVTSNGTISGSLTVLGGITGAITGSATSASYAVSASEASTLQGLGSASFAPVGTFNTVSQSYATTSGSLSTRVTNVEATASTNTQASASFATMSGSLSTRVTNLEATSSTVSSSFATTSGSIAGRVTLIEGQYATTGSNNFTKPQQISDVSNAISFTSTASLYTEGGLRVKGSSFISGTAYFNDVVVYGTSSIEYITSSQIAIGTNIITLNTDTPSIRYGGISVFDSGSNNLSTGSLFWDSEKDKWIYSNPSGSTYDGGMLISGPRNSSGLGNEVGTTNNALMKGQGGDHITSSGIFDYGTCANFYSTALFVTGSGKVGINTVTPQSTLEVQNGHIRVANNSTNTAYIGFGASDGTTGFTSGLGVTATAHQYEIYDNTNGATRLKIDNTGAACFSGVVCVGTNLVVQAASTFCNTVGLFGVAPQLYIGGSSGASDFAILQWCATNKSLNIHNQSTGENPQLIISCEGNIGIKTNSPGYPLEISYTGGYGLKIGTNDATSANNAAIFFSNDASATAGSRRSYMLLDPNGGNGSGGDYAYLDMFGSGNATLMNQLSTGNLILGTAGTTRLFVCSNGYVGIGTNAPFGPLVVYQSNSGGLGGHIILNNNGAAVANETAVMFGDGGIDTIRAAISSTTEGSPYYGSLKFKTGLGLYACLTTQMTITGAGNVGIGFSTVTNKLQVAGEITTHAGTNTSYYSYMNYLGTTWNFGSGEVSDAVNFRICGASASTAGNAFGFWTQPGNATPLLRLKIDKNGYVGINNSCPRASLEVNQACSNVDNGGFMFKTMYIDDNVWTSFFTPPANWAGLTTFNWTGTNDYNRSGAAQIRWSYQSCAAQLGPTTTIFNDSQNAQPCWRYSGGDMQIYINGAGAGKRLQIMIMGSRGS